ERRGGADATASAAHLNSAIRAAGAARLGPGLYGGLAGIAWASQHIRSRLTPEAEIGHRSLDEALLSCVRRTPWRSHYDLIAGLVGIGVYAAERLPRPSAVELLTTVVDRLEETAEPVGTGVTWHTRPQLLPRLQREENPAGYYNLGVAHGVPGVVGLLGLACAAGVAPERARALLDGAVRWLLAQRLPEGAVSSFGDWVVPGAPPDPWGSRCAWCYGDAGAAAALSL